MEITQKFLRQHGACPDGYEWYVACGETDHEAVIRKLMAEDHFNWANWVIVRLMNHRQQVQYAVFAAEKVLVYFESKHPDDKRPRKAIEAANAYLNNVTDAVDAAAAADAAYAAARAAADAAYAAARAAARAAADAAYAAYAADAAYAAAYAAYAADAARAAAAVIRAEMIEYGLILIGDVNQSKN